MNRKLRKSLRESKGNLAKSGNVIKLRTFLLNNEQGTRNSELGICTLKGGGALTSSFNIPCSLFDILNDIRSRDNCSQHRLPVIRFDSKTGRFDGPAIRFDCKNLIRTAWSLNFVTKISGYE
jgi:hypothetical protein